MFWGNQLTRARSVEGASAWIANGGVFGDGIPDLRLRVTVTDPTLEYYSSLWSELDA